MSSRNTRKAKRKLWSLKEGNPREEQALLYVITELIQTVDQLTGDVHSLCVALAELSLDAEASCLHEAMSDGLQHVDLTRRQVWPASVAKNSGSDAEPIDLTFKDFQLTFPPSNSGNPSWHLDIYT